MKEILIIILAVFALKTYSQEGKYEYSNSDCFESIVIESDSFVYKHSCGLMFGETNGTVKYINDTLILNSDIQPSFLLNEKFDSLLHNDTISIVIKNVEFPNQYGLRVLKGGDYYDLDLQNSSIIRVEFDSIEHSTSYYFTTNLFTRKQRLMFILYRTNLRIELDWKRYDNNKFEIIFNELPNVVDYDFFTNKRAIVKKSNLILLDEEGMPETTYYTIKTKKNIRISKKKKVKIYKKSS